MWSNDIKCKYMFMLPLKNLARKGLTLLVLRTENWTNQVNTIAANALALCFARSSTTVVHVFTMYNEQGLVFHREGFKLPVPNQCQEMIENTKSFLYFLRVKLMKCLSHLSLHGKLGA